MTTRADAPPALAAAGGTITAILLAMGFSHLLNDLMQSLVPAIYPTLKQGLGLSFGQIGGITLVNQITASILQPVVGHYTDRRPMPFSLPFGMASTLVGLLMLSQAGSYPSVLCAVACVGVGSSVFHPEGSRVVRLASGGRHGMAQAVFQVGGNAGSALGPLLAAFIIAPRTGHVGGQGLVAWFGLAAITGIAVLGRVSLWYRHNLRARAGRAAETATGLGGRRVAFAMAVLVALMLSKFVFAAGMGNYYQFYLIDCFGADKQTAQLCLFLYLAAFAAGTVLGGPIGDRIGRERIIWVSILGVLPFSLALPYAGMWGAVLLTVPIGLLLASAFPAIVVYAQELMPGRVGAVSGLMFGLAFGLGGLGAAALGILADHTSIRVVFELMSVLPALGLLAALLPKIGRQE